MSCIKDWGYRIAVVMVLVALNPSGHAGTKLPSRRLDPVPEPLVQKMKEPLPFPRYLKVWNDTNTPGEVDHQLKNVTSNDWKNWYARTHKNVKLHRTSVEFMQREMFFVRSSGSLTLINTSRMEEGVLLISRRPFRFDRTASLSAIAARLQKENLNQRYESGIPFFRMLQLLFHSTVSVAGTDADNVRIAPMLALIDIERSRASCLDLLEATPQTLAGGNHPRRGIASVPARPLPPTAECQQALFHIVRAGAPAEAPKPEPVGPAPLIRQQTSDGRQ